MPPKTESKVKGKSLNQAQRELLNLYYKRKEECDHIWVEGQFILSVSDLHDSSEGLPFVDLTAIFNQLSYYSKNDKKALIIHFHSGGGKPHAGIMLHNIIKKFPKPVIGVIEGICYSAATYPFMACDLRIIKPYATFLIHQTTFYSLPTRKFKQLRRIMQHFQIEHKLKEEFWLKNSNLTLSQIKHFLKTDQIISPKECVKHGIVHEIFSPSKVKKVSLPKKIPADVDTSREVVINTFMEDLPELIKPEVIKSNYIKSIQVYTNSRSKSYGSALKQINLMLEVPVPITFVSISPVSNGQWFMSLFAKKSFMVDNLSHVTLWLDPILAFGPESDHSDVVSMEDKMFELTYYRKLIKNIIRQKTKLPTKILNSYYSKTHTFTPNLVKKYQMVDQIITLNNNVFSLKDTLDKALKKKTPSRKKSKKTAAKKSSRKSSNKPSKSKQTKPKQLPWAE